MFTGIVGLGRIVSMKEVENGIRLALATNMDIHQTDLGESIAVDGICLSASSFDNGLLHFFVSPETIKKTALSQYKEGRTVNLEWPTKPNGFMGGHYVLGHVDTVGMVLAVDRQAEVTFMKIAIPEPFQKYVVYKGSIAVNGVSLTINEDHGDHIELCLIPITLEKSSLGQLHPGDRINLEFDILAKYTEKLLRKK